MSLKDTDVKTLGNKAIAKKFKLSLAKVRQLVDVGAKHEKEHNTDLEKAKQVARDHIGERPDYYKMLKKAEKTKVSMEEETGVGSVRGFGNVTGDPAVGSNSYVDTNAMAYQDENGNKLEWIKKKHSKLHGKLGFSSFDPTSIDGNKNFVNEGISAGAERTQDYSIGDAGGGRTLYRPREVKEVTIPSKVKKAVATGMTLANIATLGQVAGNAAEGRGSPKRDVVAAASGLPGKIGWGATAGHYSIKGMDKIRHYIKDKKQMKEDKDPCWKGYEMVGMKKKGSRKVPNCVPVKESGQVMSRYTERPTYENKSMGETLPKAGGAERGIYQEGYASIGHAYDWAGDVNKKAKFYGDKPKATTTKNDEKDDTYKDSNKGKKVKFAKTVKEAQIDEISHGLALKAMKKSEKRANDEYESDQAHDRLSDYQTHDERATRLRSHMRKKFGNDKPGRGNTGGDKLSGRTMSDRLTHGKRAGMPSARHKNDLKSSIQYSLGKHPKANLPEEAQIDEFISPLSFITGLVQDKISGQSDRDKEIKNLKTNINQKRKIDSIVNNAEWPNNRIDEIKASTVGRAVAKASAKRKELTSKKMGDKEIKQWWKAERLVRRGTEKLTGKSKVPPSMEDDPPFFPSHGRKHTKGSSAAHNLAVKAMKKQKSQLKEELMDTKDLIQEAIGNIMEENLHEMKDNLMTALQEKAMEKLEERKKEIASSYFAQ